MGWIALGLVAWFIEPARKIDWIPIMALGVSIGAVNSRIKDIEKKLDSLKSRD